VQLLWWVATASGAPPPSLRIHDLHGRLIRSITLDGERTGSVWWQGDGDDGHPLASGIYFVTLDARDASVTRKVVLVRP